MKKNDYSYKNLYQNLKQDFKANNLKQQLIHQNKIQRISKQINPHINNHNSIKNHQIKGDLKQFHSTKDKENDSRSGNRIHTESNYESLRDNSKLRKQFKLYNFTEEDDKVQLKKKVEKLEDELKKKLIDHGFMNYFKINNTSTNLTHLDIYLELISFEEAINNKQKIIKQQQNNLAQCYKEIQQLLVLKEQNEKRFLTHTEQIKNCNETIEKLKNKIDKKQQEDNYYEKYIEIKNLFGEIQKQKSSLFKRIKQLQEVYQIQQATYNMKIYSIKENYENEKMQANNEIKRLKDQIEKYHLRCQQFSVQHKQFLQNEQQYKKNIEKLQNESSDLKKSINQLQEQINNRNQTDKQYKQLNYQLKKQINSLNQTIKQQTKIKNQEIHQLKNRLTISTQKYTEYESIKGDYLLDSKKLNEKVNSLKQQIKILELKLNHAQVHSSQSIEKMKFDIIKYNQEKQLYKSQLLQKLSNIKTLSNQIKQLKEQINKQQAQSLKSQKIIQKYQNQNTAYQMKIQSLNQKKQSNQRYKILGKVKEITSKIKMYIPETLQIPVVKENTDQLERAISEINQIVIILINELIQPLKKEINSLTTNINTLQIQKQEIQKSKQIQLQLKQQAIKTLIKFTPEQLNKIIQQYLLIIQDLPLVCTNELFQKKINLINSINKQYEKIKEKSRQQEELKKARSHINYAQNKFQVAVRKSDVRKVQKSIPPIDVFKKYFE